MAKDRISLNRAALALCDLLEEGGEITVAHQRAAEKLRQMALSGGTYQKQYATHEERVLQRHLNLYKNKLAGAATESQRAHWREKLRDQQRKVDAFKRGDKLLDLDGL